MAQAVILGAGSVGRGFIGQLFAESGYHVVFVDIDEPLIATLDEQGSYRITLVDNERHAPVVVSPVSGMLSQDIPAVVGALAEAPLGATAVGVRALPQIAPLIAQAIQRRVEGDSDLPLNIIVCENLPDAAHYLRELIAEHLDAAEQQYLNARVGLVNAVIGRMVPEPGPEQRARDITAIVTEPYKELPVDRTGFVGDIPDIVGLEAHDPFAPYIARKLYLHNGAHAIMGYLGYHRGHMLGFEALEDPAIRPVLEGALNEAVQGLLARFGLAEDSLQEYLADLLPRLGNRPLADPIARLARDPLRKLAPGDRLVGPARAAESAGLAPDNLAWGIAGALAFDAPQDPTAEVLQQRIEAEGVGAVMVAVCGIEADEPLGRLVLERYAQVVRGAFDS